MSASNRLIQVQISLTVVAVLMTLAAAWTIPGIITKRNELARDVATLEKEKAQTTADIRDLDAKVSELRIQEMQARDSLNQVVAQVGEARSQLARNQMHVAERTLAQVGAPEALPDTQPDTARVYLHIRSDASRALAEGISKQLAHKGLNVPGIQVVPSIAAGTSELRFFRRNEESEAQAILDFLNTQFPGLGFTLAYVPKYEESKAIRPHHFELWLGPRASAR
jgi:hypothetical protein